MIRRMLITITLILFAGNAWATIANDIDQGVPADVIIAEALADGLSLTEILDEIAQAVGSSNIGLFQGAAMRVAAAATEMPMDSAAVQNSVNAALGRAAAQNHTGRSSGQAYAMNNANFQSVPVERITSVTGILPITAIAPPGGSGRGFGVGSGAVGARGFGGGGGGGGFVEDAICESVGSEPGCLGEIGRSPFTP